MREATASASDTRATLERAVQTSGQSVALYDLERLEILAVSPPAREQLGLDGVDLGTFDLVESSSNPDATRQLLALIRDGQLKEWKVRSRLRDASGQPFVAYATGRLLDFDKSRRLALAVYPYRPYRSTSGEEETRSGGTATALTIGSVDEHGRIDRVTGDVESMLGFAPRDLIGELFLSLLHPGDAPKVSGALDRQAGWNASPSIPVRVRSNGTAWRNVRIGLNGSGSPADAFTFALTLSPTMERLRAERISQLERHLWLIAQEVAAAGVARVHDDLPKPSALPGLEELSSRQHEILSRLLRGERVTAMAREMFLSTSTVRNHLGAIYRKFGVGSQVELLQLIYRLSQVDSPSAVPSTDPRR
jgi:DNA-binding CsgD family transcriptional regulator/PAS domain-containing protein